MAAIEREIFTCKRNTVKIASDDLEIRRHFVNPSNYADLILNQINTEQMYQVYLKDSDGWNILDFGANIGLFSLYAQDGNQVYSIEPDPKHFKILEKLTEPYDNMHPKNIALSHIDGDVDFYLSPPDNTTMNSLINKSGEKIEVKGMTLNTLLTELKLDSVDLVKCDIEGSEMLALTDDNLSKVADKIKVWFVEVHATDGRTIQQNRLILAQTFHNCGYNTHLHGEDVLHAWR